MSKEELRLKHEIAKEIAGRQPSKDGINEAADAIYKIMQAYADSQLIEYTKQLMEYTYESKAILGHDERSAEQFVNIFKEELKTK